MHVSFRLPQYAIRVDSLKAVQSVKSSLFIKKKKNPIFVDRLAYFTICKTPSGFSPLSDF